MATIMRKKTLTINNLFQSFDMSPWKTNTEQSRSTKWEKGDYTVPKMCDAWASRWEEGGQMRQLDMSHGNVQAMIGTA